mmetsp:Transcript_51766/g.103028  ORF Transcript_51766/g.103028 Transcript_51766/m.103028 type:complete len:322 (-) Transcript_51766:316-1281(-)
MYSSFEGTGYGQQVPGYAAEPQPGHQFFTSDGGDASQTTGHMGGQQQMMGGQQMQPVSGQMQPMGGQAMQPMQMQPMGQPMQMHMGGQTQPMGTGQMQMMGGQMASIGGHMNGQMMGQAAAAPGAVQSQGLARNLSATLLGEGDPNEPPILVELGIDFEHIRQKTKIVLWPRSSQMVDPKLRDDMMNDDDFAGPLLFCITLATLLLFNGKIVHGTIYGVFVVGLVGLWAVFNLMSPKGIDIYRTASIIGYSLLPIVGLAALSIIVELRGFVGALCMPLAVGWCSVAASLFFVAALDASDRRWLLAYPIALFYTCFALITVF